MKAAWLVGARLPLGLQRFVGEPIKGSRNWDEKVAMVARCRLGEAQTFRRALTEITWLISKGQFDHLISIRLIHLISRRAEKFQWRLAD